MKMTRFDVNFVRLHPTWKLADSLIMGTHGDPKASGHVDVRKLEVRPFDKLAVQGLARSESTEELFDEIEFESLMERAWDWRSLQSA